MPSILHLEDDVLDHRLVRASLAAEGLADDVVRVETEAQFLAAIQSRCFDLILSDFNLVAFDGLAALREAQKSCPETPFIIVSGAMGETAAVEILKAGATDVVLKDHLERLGPAVHRAFRESHERDARAKAESALRQSEAGLRMMVESVRDHAIFPMNVAGQITGWNVGAERLFGYAEQEIIGQYASVLFTPEDRIAEAAPRELRVAAERGMSDEERTHQRRDGSRFHASSVVTPIRDDAGNLLGFTKVARDITERKRHEDELERARELAEQANRAKDQFLAVLSHELRTPLTPVLTTAQMLERDRSLPERARDGFRLIRRNVELETRLIDDLLDLTRVSRGKMTLNIATIDVHVKIKHVVEMCRDEANDNGVRLIMQLDATRHHARGDAARMQQVVWNLIKNAVKFTPAGGQITVRSSNVDEGRMRFEVVDTGIGIEPTVMPKLFNAFEQGGQDVTRTFGGLGLGLAITKTIVELHDGKLSVTSEGKGRGASFAVDLPTVPPPPPELPIVPMVMDDNGIPSPAGVLAGESSGCRILLVEDNADTAGVMTLLLESSGHTVRSAMSVADALKSAAAEPPDIVVSDIGLPDGSGLDLMRQLRHRQPSLRGIALSGFGMEDDVRRSLAAGFSEHLTKPVSIDQLEATVKRIAEEVAANVGAS